MSPRGKGSRAHPSAWVFRMQMHRMVSWLGGLVQPPPTAPWKPAEPRPRAMELLLPCMEHIKGVSYADSKVLASHSRETAAGTGGESPRAPCVSVDLFKHLQAPEQASGPKAASTPQQPLLSQQSSLPWHFFSLLHRCDAGRLCCRLRFY